MSLDPVALDKLRALQRPGRPDVLARILAQFIQSAPKLYADLKEGFSNADFPKATMAAHTMKSSAATVGAPELAEVLRDLEHQARESRPLSSVAELEPLAALVERAVADAVAASGGGP